MTELMRNVIMMHVMCGIESIVNLEDVVNYD